MDQDSHVRLAGFSLARFSDAEDYDFELAAWTRNPASEDASNIDRKCGVEAQDLTPASDVYAFACVCLEVSCNWQLAVPFLPSLFVRFMLINAFLSAIFMAPTALTCFMANSQAGLLITEFKCPMTCGVSSKAAGTRILRPDRPWVKSWSRCKKLVSVLCDPLSQSNTTVAVGVYGPSFWFDCIHCVLGCLPSYLAIPATDPL